MMIAAEVQDLADKTCREIGEALPGHLRALAASEVARLGLLGAVQATVGRAIERAARAYGIRAETRTRPTAAELDAAWQALRDGAGARRLGEVARATGVDVATLGGMRLVRQRLMNAESWLPGSSMEALPATWDGAKGWAAAVTWMEAQEREEQQP